MICFMSTIVSYTTDLQNRETNLWDTLYFWPVTLIYCPWLQPFSNLRQFGLNDLKLNGCKTDNTKQNQKKLSVMSLSLGSSSSAMIQVRMKIKIDGERREALL